MRAAAHCYKRGYARLAGVTKKFNLAHRAVSISVRKVGGVVAEKELKLLESKL